MEVEFTTFNIGGTIHLVENEIIKKFPRSKLANPTTVLNGQFLFYRNSGIFEYVLDYMRGYYDDKLRYVNGQSKSAMRLREELRFYNIPIYVEKAEVSYVQNMNKQSYDGLLGSLNLNQLGIYH